MSTIKDSGSKDWKQIRPRSQASDSIRQDYKEGQQNQKMMEQFEQKLTGEKPQFSSGLTKSGQRVPEGKVDRGQLTGEASKAFDGKKPDTGETVKRDVGDGGRSTFSDATGAAHSEFQKTILKQPQVQAKAEDGKQADPKAEAGKAFRPEGKKGEVPRTATAHVADGRKGVVPQEKGAETPKKAAEQKKPIAKKGQKEAPEGTEVKKGLEQAGLKKGAMPGAKAGETLAAHSGAVHAGMEAAKVAGGEVKRDAKTGKLEKKDGKEGAKKAVTPRFAYTGAAEQRSAGDLHSLLGGQGSPFDMYPGDSPEIHTPTVEYTPIEENPLGATTFTNITHLSASERVRHEAKVAEKVIFKTVKEDVDYGNWDVAGAQPLSKRIDSDFIKETEEQLALGRQLVDQITTGLTAREDPRGIGRPC